MLQRTFAYNRQDRNWLATMHVEGRHDIRQDSQMPSDPVPSRFSDWSSLGSPCTRTSPHSAPDIRVDQNENIQNQSYVPSAGGTRQERIRTSSSEEGHHSPQTDQQREELSVPAIEVVPAPLNIEVGTQRNDVVSDEENEDDVPPASVSGSVRPPLDIDELVPDPNIQQEVGRASAALDGSHVRTQDANVLVVSSIIPLERLTLRRDRTMVSENISIAQHRPCERAPSHVPSTNTRRDFPADSSDDHGSSRE